MLRECYLVRRSLPVIETGFINFSEAHLLLVVGGYIDIAYI